VRVDPHRREAITAGLAQLLGDAALRARLAAAGPERARLFSWQRLGREMLEVYRRAAGVLPAGRIA
jgi:glycosyltransferase involved in cell wall biosynthesis